MKLELQKQNLSDKLESFAGGKATEISFRLRAFIRTLFLPLL